jgi:hypothetical protein
VIEAVGTEMPTAGHFGDVHAERCGGGRLVPPERHFVVREAKPSLVGSYVVSGTDPDGRSYASNGVVDISLAPSGALDLEWDNGKKEPLLC